jgi:hypothetical protein
MINKFETQPNAVAFPASEKDHTLATHGLTKREIFAMEALNGLIQGEDMSHGYTQELASIAVKYADALIEALNK